MKKLRTLSGLCLGTALLSLPATAFAQEDETIVIEDYVPYEEMIVVTGTRVTQGGAQDIEFFRESVEDGRLPAPGAVTSEGLLSTHDMVLDRKAPCEQLFCLSVEAVKADMISAPDMPAFMGLGFATNISAETWERAPLTLMAVVDTSGSMGGEPLELAIASMKETVAHLRPGDRFGLAQFASVTDVVLPVTEITPDRSKILDAIDSLTSGGSTSMEEGLELAFKTAKAAKAGFKGTTRVMLFTDEQPNVGDTHAESFIGMARAASGDGIGLTTIGVADHFGADLANQVSASRGGNLFYAENQEAVKRLFGQEFDFLVTEVAHDLKVKIKPAKGVKVAEVFGLPGDELTYKRSGEISFTIPSVFLSAKGGGIFMSLEGDVSGARNLAKISLSYVGAQDKKRGGETVMVSGLSEQASPGMALGQLLSDEYKIIQAASAAGMYGEDLNTALARTEEFGARLAALGDAAPDGELDLINNVAEILQDRIDNPEKKPAFAGRDTPLSITPLDVSDLRSYKQIMADRGVYGSWRVKRVKPVATSSILRTGSIDLRKGDLLSFNLNEDTYDETETFNARRINPRYGEPAYEVESMYVNDEDKTITLYKSDIKFKYRKRKDQLILYPEDTGLVMTLERT